MTPLRLLIDTDTASDDAVALVMALTDPRAEVVAITVVAGNVGVDQGARNARCTLEAVGRRDVPVHRGLARPLVRPLETATAVHGADGMSGMPLPEPTLPVHEEHAVEALLRLAREGGDLTLVCLGPLTNVAAALTRDPDFLARFRHVYAMAGAADCVGNVSPTAEYNVWADPEAAAIVIAAATPEQLTLVGWDVSRRDAVIAPQHQRDLRALQTPLSAFCHGVNAAVADWTREVTGLDGYDLPDPITMAVAIDPTLATASERASVRVALGDEARGQLLIDRRVTAPPANVTLVRRADGAAFRAALMAACRSDRVASV